MDEGVKYNANEDLPSDSEKEHGGGRGAYDIVDELFTEPELRNWCDNDREAETFINQCCKYVEKDTKEAYTSLLELCNNKSII